MAPSLPPVSPELDRGISLHKLEVFALVVELGRVTRAAEELYVAQPVVTVHLQSLEKKLGVTLFERSGRTLQVTDAGDRVYRWASSTIKQLRALIDELEGHRDGRLGEVLIGASMTLGTYRLPEIITAAHERRPEAEISLGTSDPESAMRAVKQGQLDFCVVILDECLDDAVLEAEVLSEEDVVLVVSPDFPLPEAVTLADIGRLRFVASPAGLLRRALSQVAFKRARGKADEVAVEYGHPEAIKDGVIDGLGAGLLFRSAVAEELADGILREIPIGDIHLTLPVYAVKRRDKELTRLQQAVWDEIREALQAPQPVGSRSGAVQIPAVEEAAAPHGDLREGRIPFEKLDNRVSLEKLEVLCLVVELGSIGRAAEQFGITPATVSAHLRSLEQRFRVTLVEKTPHGLRITEEGDRVYDFAAQTLSRGRTMMRELKNLTAGDGGAVLIGASMSIGSFLIPSVVNAFSRSRPASRITVRISDPDGAVRDVERGDLDFAIAIIDRPFPTSLLTYDQLGEEEMVLVTAEQGEPLADEISVRELSEVRLIGTSRGAAVRTMVDQALARYGVARPRTVLEMGHSLPTLYAVKRGVGAALVSHSAYDGFMAKSGGIRAVPFHDARIVIPIYAIRRRDKRTSTLEKALLGEIRSAIRARTPIARSDRSRLALAELSGPSRSLYAGDGVAGRPPVGRLEVRRVNQQTQAVRRGEK